MRTNGVLTWVLSDHLGSSTVTADESGVKLNETRYREASCKDTAFGEVRQGFSSLDTSYEYTGQLSQMEAMGLYYYVARWYDPVIAHFGSADSIIPEAGKAAAFDRYAYVNNNPMRYSDPTGHKECDNVDRNGKCINYEQINKKVRKDLEKFVQPNQVDEDKMITVGVCPFACARLSPDERNLLLDGKGNLDLQRLWRMRHIQQEALNQAAERFPGMNLWNDPGDAFRHTYWNALMTREFGKDFALAFSTAHETQFSGALNREEVFMDLHNNKVGVEIALSSPNASNEKLQVLVMEALYEGMLYVWDGMDIYLSNLIPDALPPLR